MKLYREVKASERLPKVDGEYHTRVDGSKHYDLFSHSSKYPMREEGEIECFWLEPVEITEEEIYDIVSKAIIVHDDIFGVSMDSAKAILSKLTTNETI